MEQIAREANLAVTRVIGTRRNAWATVDRLRAEGVVRLALVPPLTALIIEG